MSHDWFDRFQGVFMLKGHRAGTCFGHISGTCKPIPNPFKRVLWDHNTFHLAVVASNLVQWSPRNTSYKIVLHPHGFGTFHRKTYGRMTFGQITFGRMEIFLLLNMSSSFEIYC